MDEDWYWLTVTHLCPQFRRLQRTWKELKLHTDYCGVSGADKTFTTRWSGSRVQVWVQVRAPACHLAITPESYSSRQSKVLLQIKGRALGAALLHSLGGSDGRPQTQAFPSRRQSLRAATSSLVEKVLPLLRHWLSSRVTKILMICIYRAATSHFLFSCEMKISMEVARSCCRPKPRPSLRSIIRSVIGFWVKYDIQTNEHVPNRILCKAVDLNRRRCPRKGRLLRSESNSTATSDCGAQKLKNDVWHDSE